MITYRNSDNSLITSQLFHVLCYLYYYYYYYYYYYSSHVNFETINLRYVSNDKWQRVLWSVPFCRCELPGRERVPNGERIRRGGGCVFVQQKCRIVAELGIEHTSSFLMGFLCPTCGKLAFATIILFVLHFGIRPKRNFIHFKRMSYGIIACLVNYKFE